VLAFAHRVGNSLLISVLAKLVIITECIARANTDHH
jgi:hypothetical protein